MSLKKWNERKTMGDVFDDLARGINPIPPNTKLEPSQSVNPDMVNHPSHYLEYPLENLETIKGSMSLIEYQGFLKGTALKYLYRYRLKGKPEEDLRKAQFYQNELIKTLEGDK